MTVASSRALDQRTGRAAAMLRAARLPVALTGAGVSTPSGIPDFRSPGAGLWQTVDPLVVASLDGFRRNPDAFYQWIRPLARAVLQAEPNAAHTALADLEAQGRLAAVITQNIDLLHSRAGSRRVLELHGHIREVTCLACSRARPAQPFLRRFVEDGQTPRCPDCGAALKPSVILFGEELPARLLQEARRLAQRCDLMLVAGSSLETWPAGELPQLARRNGARLLIVNREPTPCDDSAEVVIRADVAKALPAIAAEMAARTRAGAAGHAAH